MKKIIYTDEATGGVHVITPAYNDKLAGFDSNQETEEEYLLRIMKRAIPNKRELLTARIVEEAIIPTNRYFRNAWTDLEPGEQIDVDLEQARVVHMDNLRVERNQKLEDLDPLVLRALETGDQTEVDRIAALKQALRDMPGTFDLTQYNTAEELEQARPGELDG